MNSISTFTHPGLIKPCHEKNIPPPPVSYHGQGHVDINRTLRQVICARYGGCTQRVVPDEHRVQCPVRDRAGIVIDIQGAETPPPRDNPDGFLVHNDVPRDQDRGIVGPAHDQPVVTDASGD